MNDWEAIDVLNDLLAAEQRSLLARLAETRPFLSWAGAEQAPILRQLVADQRDHQRRLTETIDALGGVPRIPTGDISSAGAHYIDIHHLLPKLLEDLRAMIDASRRATELLGNHPGGETVSAIHARHEAHAEQLEAMSKYVPDA